MPALVQDLAQLRRSLSLLPIAMVLFSLFVSRVSFSLTADSRLVDVAFVAMSFLQVRYGLTALVAVAGVRDFGELNRHCCAFSRIRQRSAVMLVVYGSSFDHCGVARRRGPLRANGGQTSPSFVIPCAGSFSSPRSHCRVARARRWLQRQLLMCAFRGAGSR